MTKNFNYISFGNIEYVEGVNTISMSRGRLFEYTPTELAHSLEELKQSSVEFLEKLPTFLCSEISRSNGRSVMFIRYGRISNLKVDKKEVVADFENLIDFGEVEFNSIDEAKDTFNADGFQLYRTHWAVREDAAEPILERLAKLKTEFSGKVAALISRERGDYTPEPPEREKNIVGSASSVETFLELLQSIPKKEGSESFFRGHEDAKFELTPSLLRKWPDGSWQFMLSEDRLCKELLIAHYDEFQSDQYCFDRLVRMQHYGLPTRLLDISGNPLVALFFSCYCGPELMSTNGEVIMFQVDENQVKYYDSDTVSCLSNLSNLSSAQKDEIDLSLAQEKFNTADVIKKLLHHIKSEKSFFEPKIVPDDLGSIICVKAKQTNTRIKSQVGAFLLFGHEATLPESGTDGLEVARITITDKKRILSQLNALNINATSVYPSIERTAEHVKARYRQPKQKI